MSVNEQQAEIEDLKIKANQYAAYKRLVNNPDFKLIILDLFMVQQCAQSVRDSSRQALENADLAVHLVNEAKAAGYLESWLQRMGNELSSASYAYSLYVSDPESYLSDDVEVTSVVEGTLNVTRS